MFVSQRVWVVGTFGVWGLLVVGAAAARAELSAGEQFAALLDDAWEFGVREDPLFATDAGDHRFDDQLPAVSLADSARRNAVSQKFLARLEAIDRDQLSPTDRVNYDIFGRGLRQGIREFEFQTHLMPISDRWGFHAEFPELPRKLSLTSVEDYENYIARLGGFDAYAAGHIELMREGVRRGMTVPAVIMRRYSGPLEAQIVDDAEKSLLYEPLRKFPDTLPESEHERLRAAARAAITDGVVAGYRRFLKFMRDEYVPNCRTTTAASALPGGREYYRYCVGKFTTLDELSPEEIHAIGKAEVARIREEMDQVIRDVGFEGDFAAFTEKLRSDPQFYAKTPEGLEKEVSHVLKRIDGKLPRLFGRLPRMPYGLRRVPDYIAPQATFAYYQRPSGDGTRAGYYYINTFNLPARPLYMLEALSLHEAVPGHHLQIALQQELEGLPRFRQYTNFTVFIEGWALYAERLGMETGFYQDPYSDFGRLTMEIWRACRLVVDTGLHYLGWTRQQAIDYMLANSAMSEHDVRAEVDRYIGWPGQALAYKTGELKIRELREDAEARLGQQFDVRAFHDVVLGSGSVPLDVLEANVDAWLQERQRVAQRDSDN